MIRNGVRGGYKLLKFSRRLGLLDKVVRYPISDAVTLDVPVGRRDNHWDRTDILEYEKELVERVCMAARHVEGALTLVDCGADIGIITVRLAAELPGIERVLAFEPNPEAFEFLEANVGRLPVAGEAINAAVADFIGCGELRAPEHARRFDHAKFVVPAEEDGFPVLTIDSLDLPPGSNLLLKIDVEGGELAVIRGATKSIADATQAIVVFEAHREQVARTGIEPRQIVQALSEIRPFRFELCERPEKALDLDGDFFAHLPEGRGYNVLAQTTHY